MPGLPDVLFVVDPKKEEIAVKEANMLNIPVVAMIDTNANPEVVDVKIPANDDAIRAVRLITAKMADAIIEGRQGQDSAPEDAFVAGDENTESIEEIANIVEEGNN